MLLNHLTQRFIKAVSNIQRGSIKINLPNGQRYAFQGTESGYECELTIYDQRAILAFALHGDIGFAESYQAGLWDSPDLAALFSFGLDNDNALKDYINASFIGRIAARFSYLFTRNTLNGSKKNIHAHYDLGNEFYKLWLDPSMTYSSAIFSSSYENLLPAQYRKYDRIIEQIHPSGSLLEIGCGWGGFAERALDKGDYEITGLTISQEQYDYAQKRLKGDATISLTDYRLQQGQYDQIVSIEMFEAVGQEYWATYFQQIKKLLAQNGKALIQTITIDEQYFTRYSKGGDPIRSFIFPGGLLPSLARFEQESQKAGLKVGDKFAFGLDYALTLKHWLQQFESQLDKIKQMGFDDKFIRMWRFYLTCCIASFSTKRTSVMQIELVHG